jgi:hypothetical protein
MSQYDLIEYRVRPVTRYTVTRYERVAVGDEKAQNSAICGRGEYDNAEVAYEIAYALARADHERKGYPIDDPRIQYPRHPNEEGAVELA